MEPNQKQTIDSTAFIVFISLCVGVLSGLTRFFFPLAFLEGFAFGAVTLPWFLFLCHKGSVIKRKWIVGFLWLAGSALSYALYEFLTAALGMMGSDLPLGSLAGVLLLAGVFHLLFHKIHPLLWIFLCTFAVFEPFASALLSGGLPYSDTDIWIRIMEAVVQGLLVVFFGYAVTFNQGEVSIRKKFATMAVILLVIAGGLFTIVALLNESNSMEEYYLTQENDKTGLSLDPDEYLPD